MAKRDGKRARPWTRYLLLLPLAVLWVPSFNSATPALWGFPFFYWYQMAWVIVSAAIIAFVYFTDSE